MPGTVAVGQGAAPQQLPHAFGPPALGGIGLGEQIADGNATTHKHHRLAQQPGLVDVAQLFKPLLGKVGISQEGERLQHPRDGSGAG